MNEFTKEKLERFDKQLQEARNQLEYLEDSLIELKDICKVSSEVDDFLYELSDNENLPDEIRNKAGELWKQI